MKSDGVDEGLAHVAMGQLKTAQDTIEQLKAERDKLQGDIQEMVKKAASKHRPAYDEQQQKIMELVDIIESLQDRNKKLVDALEEVGSCLSTDHRGQTVLDYSLHDCDVIGVINSVIGDGSTSTQKSFGQLSKEGAEGAEKMHQELLKQALGSSSGGDASEDHF